MELNLKINATQFIYNEGEGFLDGEIKSPKENPFALVPFQGTVLKVNEDYWLVEYHDGTREVWNTDEIEERTDYKKEEEARPEESGIQEVIEKPEETQANPEATEQIQNPQPE